MSFSSETPVPTSHVEDRRARAALRLLLDGHRADAAAAALSTSDDQFSTIRSLAADLERDRQIAGALARFGIRRRLAATSATPIPPAVPSRAALALALHLGLELDAEELADALGLDEPEVGADLYLARTLAEPTPVACSEFAWMLGLYRDRRMDPDARVRLLSHIKSCGQCADALDDARHVDERLLAIVESDVDRLPERLPMASAQHGRYRTTVFVVGAVLGLLAVVIGISTVTHMLSPPEPPVPLFVDSSPPPAPLGGWLLQVSPIGSLEGVNLATGHRRGLDSGGGGNVSPVYRVSDTHFAAWRPSDGQQDDILTIGPIGDQIDYRLTWNRANAYWYPTGWLDDTTFLIVKAPEYIASESQVDYLARLARDSQLVAFDALTGRERVLMRGNVAAAYPSPDGTMLAIVPPIDRRWPGNTLELRPFDGESVGEPIVRIERRVVAEGVWLADSSQYITSVILDETVSIRESAGRRNFLEWGVQQSAMVAIDRDGQQRILQSVTSPDTIEPIASAPDGRSIVYLIRRAQSSSLNAGVAQYDWRCLLFSVVGGQSVLLVDGGSPERIFRPTWSPDGETMLLPVARGFLLAGDDDLPQTSNLNATELLVFEREWRPGMAPRVLYSSGRDLHGWIPDGKLRTKGFGDVEQTPDETEPRVDGYTITSGSVAGRDGALLIADERGSGTPVIWNVEEDAERRLALDAADLTWFNQGTLAIGVASDVNDPWASRIVIYSASIASSAAYLDHRQFDPAGLGADRNRRYAHPRVAPSGTLVSFFVVDGSANLIELWVAAVGREPAIVIAWSMPVDREVEPPLLASWIGSDTIVVAQPDAWQDGTPNEAVLHRLTISLSGETTVDELVRFETRRDERGLVISEFALSPDRDDLAYRLRHFDTTSSSGTRYDTLHVASTADLGRAIEVERGGVGDGLTWSGDSEWLVAGTRGRIARYSADGRHLEYLSPRGLAAAHPLLVGDAIWFAVTDTDGEDIWQVEDD